MRTNKEQLLQFETYEFIKQITIDTHTQTIQQLKK